MSWLRTHFVRVCVATLFGVVGTVCCGVGQGEVGQEQAKQPRNCAALVQQALQNNTQTSRTAIQELRELGPDAVKYLLSHEELRKSPNWSTVLDAVAQQRDAQYAGLYWYTDLEQALAVAKEEQKPVLSLRLLGKLTDELSCANSRYFRTTLYPHHVVRKLLSEKFVLHWQSVRSVPLITIDFGDGRQIKRTITGNSLHLILDHEGRPIDVLPGLYGAGEFVRELQAIEPATLQLAQLNGTEFQKQRASFHNGRIKAISDRWTTDCLRAQVMELASMGLDQSPATWTKLAALYAAESTPTLDAQAAVASKQPPRAEDANQLVLTKSRAETPMMRLVRNIGNSISEDSVRNEYHLHVRIHNWFSSEQPTPEPEVLVARVYAELFLSPLNDPWYGLSRPDTYSAIPQDGRIHAVTQNAGH